MGVIKRQSIKGTLTSYLGMGLGFFNVLILMTKCLTPEQVGLIRSMLDGALLFVPFIIFGATNVAIKYFPFFKKDKERYRSYLGYLIYIPLITFLLFTIILIVGKDQIQGWFIEKSPMIVDYYYFIIPLIFFIVYLRVFESYIRTLFRITVPKLIKEVVLKIVTSVIIVIFFIQWVDFNNLAILFVCSYGVMLILLIGYVFKLKEGPFNPSLKIFSDSLFKKMVTYSLFMVMGTGGGIIATKIGTLMTSAMLGLEFAAVYSIAYVIGGVIEIPARALTQITSPFVSNAIKNNNSAKLDELYTKTALNNLVIGSLIFLLIWSNIDNLFQLMPKSEIYSTGKYVVLFIALSKLFSISMGINSEILVNSKYYRWNIYLMASLAIIASLGNYLLIPIYGIEGAALSIGFSIVVYNLLRFLLIWLKFSLQPFSFRNGIVVCIGILVWWLITWVPEFENYFIDILVRSLMICVLFVTPIFLLKISLDFNSIITNLLTKFKI